MTRRRRQRTAGAPRSWAVDYSARSAYRPPPAWYRRLQAIAPAVLRAGLGPRYAVLLEVPGRVSGTPQRVGLVLVEHDRHRYLVSLTGESDWVRNVRAASGHAVLTARRVAHRVRLEEVPAEHRTAILLAYVNRGGPLHPAGHPRSREARIYLGLGPHPTAADVERIVDHYPVFRVHAADPSPGTHR